MPTVGHLDLVSGIETLNRTDLSLQ